jgi:type I restriction enzyme, R subunit
MSVWRAYEQLETVRGQPKNELVALLRRVTGADTTLTPYDKTVDRNFQQWLFKKQAGTLKFSKEQMDWLYMLKEQIAISIHVETDDLDYTPFDAQGGRGRMWQLFGAEMENIMEELNEALVE